MKLSFSSGIVPAPATRAYRLIGEVLVGKVARQRRRAGASGPVGLPIQAGGGRVDQDAWRDQTAPNVRVSFLQTRRTRNHDPQSKPTDRCGQRPDQSRVAVRRSPAARRALE